MIKQANDSGILRHDDIEGTNFYKELLNLKRDPVTQTSATKVLHDLSNASSIPNHNFIGSVQPKSCASSIAQSSHNLSLAEQNEDYIENLSGKNIKRKFIKLNNLVAGGGNDNGTVAERASLGLNDPSVLQLDEHHADDDNVEKGVPLDAQDNEFALNSPYHKMLFTDKEFIKKILASEDLAYELVGDHTGSSPTQRTLYLVFKRILADHLESSEKEQCGLPEIISSKLYYTLQRIGNPGSVPKRDLDGAAVQRAQSLQWDLDGLLRAHFISKASM
jgi:hypothetical protein